MNSLMQTMDRSNSQESSEHSEYDVEFPKVKLKKKSRALKRGKSKKTDKILLVQENLPSTLMSDTLSTDAQEMDEVIEKAGSNNESRKVSKYRSTKPKNSSKAAKTSSVQEALLTTSTPHSLSTDAQEMEEVTEKTGSSNESRKVSKYRSTKPKNSTKAAKSSSVQESLLTTSSPDSQSTDCEELEDEVSKISDSDDDSTKVPKQKLTNKHWILKSKYSMKAANSFQEKLVPASALDSESTDAQDFEDEEISLPEKTSTPVERKKIKKMKQRKKSKKKKPVIIPIREKKRTAGSPDIFIPPKKKIRIDTSKNEETDSSFDVPSNVNMSCNVLNLSLNTTADSDVSFTFGSPDVSLKEKKPEYKISSMCGLIDTHCHLDFLFEKKKFKGTFSKFRSLYSSTFPECYEGCIAIFCNPSTFSKQYIWENLLKETDIWGAFGCHPHMAASFDENALKSLQKALEHQRVVALGEIGLDYSPKNNCPHYIQKKVFIQQLQICFEKKLPLVLHSRDATDDCIEILEKELPKDYPIHRHCFTGNWVEAQMWLKKFPGLFIGLTSLVTYNSVKHLHEVARRIPLDRLLFETDAPFFVPPLEKNEHSSSHPGMVINVAIKVAELKNLPVEEVLIAVRYNTEKFYKI